MEAETVATMIAIPLAGAAMVYWIVVLAVVLLLRPKIPRISDALAGPLPGRWPPVSIVVPAHNEERVIEACARSLLASDYPDLEVIFVLDRCTDRTRALLAGFEVSAPAAAGKPPGPRLRVIENNHCPEDWAGKCNAARVGADAATGDYLLFTDADVSFDPQLVRASVASAIAGGRGLLSLLPTLTTERWFERVVQPVAAMTLLRIYPIDRVNRDERRRPFANGQFMLFERRVYQLIGGHAAVKDDLLEDIAFARVVEGAGERGAIAVADGMLVVNMYGSLDAMQTGWKRIFIEACKRKPSRLRQHAARLFTVGQIAPIVQVLAIVAGLLHGGPLGWLAIGLVLVGLLTQALALALIYAMSRSPISGAIFYPLGALVVAKALWDGARDLESGKPIRWGGRAYVLTPRQ
jgi:chlorobactene glucosyltransferase